MRWKATGFFTVVAVCASCATNAARPAAQRAVPLPAVLHGTWEVGPEPCKLPGNPDSDSRIVIEEDRIDGYEDWSEALAVTAISTSPPAWRLRIREHFQEEVYESDLIFSVTSKDRSSLTIIDESRAETYVRCI